MVVHVVMTYLSKYSVISYGDSDHPSIAIGDKMFDVLRKLDLIITWRRIGSPPGSMYHQPGWRYDLL